MGKCFAARRTFQRIVPALGLCILAFLFAFEAKLAWYSPPRDPGSQVAAAKALRADSPALISHGNSAPERVQQHAAATVLALVSALPLAPSDPFGNLLALSADRSVRSLVFLVPSIGFRPPPVA
jgi:hypothetical protein